MLRFAPILILLAGCGGTPSGLATASGEVRLHGRPLSGGLIAFTPDPDRGSIGRPVVAELQSDGQFRLPDDLKPGWYRVSISDPPGAWTADGLHFPNHLRRPDQSGLVREVVAGRAHRFDFHIDWKR